MHATEGIRAASSYDEVLDNIDFTLERASDKTYTEYGKALKARIDKDKKRIKKGIDR